MMDLLSRIDRILFILFQAHVHKHGRRQKLDAEYGKEPETDGRRPYPERQMEEFHPHICQPKASSNPGRDQDQEQQPRGRRLFSYLPVLLVVVHSVFLLVQSHPHGAYRHPL